MPRDGSLTPSDLVGKHDWLNVRCEKRGRHGRYNVASLVEGLGLNGKLTDWLGRITRLSEEAQRRHERPVRSALPGLIAGDVGFRAAPPPLLAKIHRRMYLA
jgi:hypothetical protein